MDFTETKNVLAVIESVGIDELVIDIDEEEDNTLLRGANKDHNIIIFDHLDSKLSEHPIGVQSVRGLLSRLNLFDHNKASIETDDDGDRITNIKMKEGRKKASYRCSHSDNLAVPKQIPGNLESENRIELSKEFVDYLSQAVQSMSYTGNREERVIRISIKNEVMSITVFDGEDDSFSDEVSVDGVDDVQQCAWEVAPFQKVLKRSVESSFDESAHFHITEHGVAVIQVGVLNIMIAPVA